MERNHYNDGQTKEQATPEKGDFAMLTRDHIDFLLRAKRATYAGKGPQTQPSRPQSHDLAYSEGDLSYLDTYLGGARFAGEEALYVAGRPVWAMNYLGRVLADGFDGDFLKAALLLGTPEAPWRGPAEFAQGTLHYRCSTKGDIDWFYGYEIIERDGVAVYECAFHGGALEG